MEVMNSIKHDFLSNLSETNIKFNTDILNGAKDALSILEVPTTRNEKWKYTRLGKIKNSAFISPIHSHSMESIPAISGGPRFSFHNGILDKQNSVLDKVNFDYSIFSDSASAINESKTSNEDIFDVINTVYLHDGIELNFGKNQIQKELIHIELANDSDDQLINYRIRIKAAAGSESKICIIQKGTSNSFTNVILESDVDENAHLNVYLLQMDSNEGRSITSSYIDQNKNSNFTIETITLGGLLVRNNLRINVNGEGCETNLFGAYLLNNDQHVDNHTIVDHRVANCNSNELYKGVINDKATAVFNGKVFVRKDAQKTNAFQSNGNVLLSDDASVNSKPELEIYADDVKCSHGSTTGQLDDEAIYYLRSRGISEDKAQSLLVSAFVGEVLEQTNNDDILEFLKTVITEKYGWEF